MCERCQGGGVFWDLQSGVVVTCECEAGQREQQWMDRAWRLPDEIDQGEVAEEFTEGEKEWLLEELRDCPF
jgi:hypothetical protein